jgi:hypothetical protein
MPFVPKVPDSCLDLDPTHVSRALAKHLPTSRRRLVSWVFRLRI